MLKRPLLALLVALLTAFSAPVAAGETSLEAQIQAATGIPRAVNVQLVALAQKRAVEASAVPEHRYLQELSDSGVWSSWGEVLAWGYAADSSVISAWLNSPGHRAILLNPDYDSIGCGSYFGGGRLTIACILANHREAVSVPDPVQDSPPPAPAPAPQPSAEPVSPVGPALETIPDTAMR